MGSLRQSRTQNLYTYVVNSPVNLVDSTGHRPALAEGENTEALGAWWEWHPKLKAPNPLLIAAEIYGVAAVGAVGMMAVDGLLALLPEGAAVGTTAGEAGSADTASFIKTPYGSAVQETNAAATQLRGAVKSGETLYRAGEFGRSLTADAQFWAPENSLNPGYADSYGVDFKKVDFIIGGQLQEGADFITRSAPGLGGNLGGAMEVVTNPGAVRLGFFHMP